MEGAFIYVRDGPPSADDSSGQIRHLQQPGVGVVEHWEGTDDNRRCKAMRYPNAKSKLVAKIVGGRAH